jgi:hypothetical protein
MEDTLYKLWAAIGPLIGVFIGSWLGARWQRTRWIQDNKKTEYRQLLDSIQTYRWRLLKRLADVTGPLVALDARTRHEEATALADAQVLLTNCLGDRLFVREQLAKSKVKDDLSNFLRTIDRTSEEAIGALDRFHDRIVAAAEADLGLK